MDTSPVEAMVNSIFNFLDFPKLLSVLGVAEVIIGLGLLFKVGLRVVLALLWIQLIGTFAALFLEPEIFFGTSLLKLTTSGEFVVKNLVLMASGMVIGGYQVNPMK